MILVVGGGGFIGKHLVKVLINHGNVIVVDKYMDSKTEDLLTSRGVETWKEDIINVLNDIKDVEVAFHLAAIADVNRCENNKGQCFHENVLTTSYLAEWAYTHNIKLIFSSSAAVYGNKNPPLKETMKPNPISFYGLSKYISEEILKYYIKKGLRAIMLRYFNVFGEGGKGVINAFIRAAKKGSITIFGDGTQTRDFVYVGDVVDANIKAWKSTINKGIFNIASGKPISINEIANIFKKYLNVEVIYKPAKEFDIKHSYASISKAQKILKWKPNVDVRKWLAKHLTARK